MKTKKISITEFNQNISLWIKESKFRPIALTKKGTTVAYLVNKGIFKLVEELRL